MLPLCLALLAVTLFFPLPAPGQSYQRYSDGLVSVEARKVSGQDEPPAVEVCARLQRHEEACPVEVRLTFRGSSGHVVAQTSPVLVPEYPEPACLRIPLPPEARETRRWEISRFRCKR